MTRKHPNARRAVALALLASFLLAANAGALFTPNKAQAETTVSTPGRRPLPGDPNIPDEGGRTTVTTTSEPRLQDKVVIWFKDVVHYVFLAR